MSNKGKSWMDLTMMERVGDRKKWKDLVRQAKAHSPKRWAKYVRFICRT
jgi:hypothetical protein